MYIRYQKNGVFITVKCAKGTPINEIERLMEYAELFVK